MDENCTVKVGHCLTLVQSHTLLSTLKENFALVRYTNNLHHQHTPFVYCESIGCDQSAFLFSSCLEVKQKMSGIKRKRIVLTAKQKLDIVQKIEKRESISKLANKWGIGVQIGREMNGIPRGL